MPLHINSVKFKNFKALENFTISLNEFDVLVGPNNFGKSTLISAFRALAGAIRKAEARKPEWINFDDYGFRGHRISEELHGLTLENVHTNYTEEDTKIIFKLSNNNSLTIHFPKDGGCILEPIASAPCDSPTAFKKHFPIDILVLPIMSRLEQTEKLVDKDVVTKNLYSHRASRNFRNYWYYFPDEFEIFANYVEKTWPGMKINPPEFNAEQNEITMFCEENRITREIFWSGSGFQIWCQILTYLSRAKSTSILVIDEPEIYLHPDLQRKLVYILRDLRSDIVIATHSTEIMAEVDPSDILVIDKSRQAAQRLKQLDEVQKAIETLGSSQNITLTKLARTRRIIFVESLEDFKILQKIAHKLGYEGLSEESSLTPVASGGFTSWERISALEWGFKKSLGKNINIAVIYDRDYRCDEEITEISEKLKATVKLMHFFSRKEVENYLLEPYLIESAVKRAILERESRTSQKIEYNENMTELIMELSELFKDECQSQYIAHKLNFLTKSSKDAATIAKETIQNFNMKWSNIQTRLQILPGKKTLKSIRNYIQNKYNISISDVKIVNEMKKNNINIELKDLFEKIVEFENLTND